MSPVLVAATLFLVAQGAPEQFRAWGRKAKAHAYLADPGLEAPAPVKIAASPEEEKRGFVVFPMPVSEAVLPGFTPGTEDRCAALAAADCPGQYGAVTFGFLALRPCGVSVRLSPLKGPRGAAIGERHLEVRAVRYVRLKSGPAPLLLEALEQKTVAAGRLQQFWITYWIPEDAPAGEYSGRAGLLVDGGERLALPFRLRVRPFPLADPGTNLYIYTERAASEELAALHYADQRCHGMNMSMVHAPVTREGELKRDELVRALETYRAARFPRPGFHIGLWNRISSEWLNTPDRSIGMWGPWFRYYPFSDALDRRYVEAVRTIRDEARRRGLDPVLAVADEAGSHPWTIKAAQHYNALVRKEVPDVRRELTVGGGWASRQPEHELWKGLIHIWTTNRWLPEKLDLVRRDDPGAKIQIYNMGGAGSGPGGLQSARLVYGFFAWKARADGVAQWVYHHGATPEHNYTWPAEAPGEGHVPTLRWEAVREGTKDRRYVATLEKRLEGRKGEAAEGARKLLEEIASRIELRHVDYDPVSGGRVPAPPPGTCEEWRDRIAGFIERLGDE